MDLILGQFIGYPFNEVEAILLNNELSFKVIEVWDRKKTKLGNDLRVIKIETGPEIQIYVAYF